ncbi:hypothetical protein Cni_G17781 [Canna indica]|uniref:Glycosyltransferase n=1 Tax=Canna indica TaxID=4628 RepID=A0AAQ3QH37_9LILI|nr:hypothetical protein Cni_G17781 [Canna indica]
MELKRRQLHFLVATFPFQGHINPALYLAKHLARTLAGVLVTFSTTLSAHRRMFPSSPDDHYDGLLYYSPFSDGFDFDGAIQQFGHYMAGFKVSGPRNFSVLIADLAARGRPVSCVIYTMLLPWAADVALEHGIPSVHYWIQPATVFAVYYHYFHGYGALVDAHCDNPSFTVTLPGLPPLKIRDVPSFLTSPPDHLLYSVKVALSEAFAALNREKAASPKPKVLVNTFDELEPDALTAVDEIDLLTIGPLIHSWSSGGNSSNLKEDENGTGGDMFKPEEKGYLEWLDSNLENSVVYVSFGSLHVFTKSQLEEFSSGLEESGRPYLWVVRRDNREATGVEIETGGHQGMMVAWCSQVKVLSHPAVGCFVTHCGWNSTLESLACGVPTVGVPRLSDQATTARMAEVAWGTGVTVELSGEGMVEASELKRCVEMVMGEGERGVKMRRKAAEWKEKARAAVSEGGSSDRNLRVFLEEIRERL